MLTANDNVSSLIDTNHPAFCRFLEIAQALVDRDRNSGRPACLARDVLTAEVGRRYIRIVCASTPSSRSAWAFVDRTNGDILKPDGWKRPAKHARGNILSGDVQGVSGYGPAYIG